MKIEGFFADNISPSIVSTIDDAIDRNVSNFNELTSALGLNPASDFRHSDLSNIDFSGSDIRGYDFTGANLCGAIGVDVKWDKSTILLSADVRKSFFASEIQEGQFFKDNPAFENEFALLSNSYWADQILYIGNRIRTCNTEKMKLFARRLLRETKSSVVRSDVLYIMQYKFGNTDENFDFLISMFSNHSNDVHTIKWAITLMADLFYVHRPSFDIMLKYLDNPHRQIRLAAYRGVFRSPYVKKYWNVIIESIIHENDSEIRRKFVEYTLRIYFPRYAKEVLFEPLSRSCIDFKDKISADTIRRITYHFLHWKYPGMDESHVERFVPIVREIIMKMKEIGVPFEIEHSSQVTKPNGVPNKPIVHSELMEDETLATVRIIASH